MKILQITLQLVFILFYSTGLAQTGSSKTYDVLLKTLYGNSTVPTISCSELKKMPDVVLLDTRERKEYDVSHLPNARWVGYSDFDISRVKDIPKGAYIVTYCTVGYRSDKVGKKLLDAGYQQVHNLYGSLFEWVNEGNAVVDGTGKATERIHAYSPTWGIWLQRGEKVY